MQPGGAKVVSWDFDELRELLAQHSGMSVAFHGALARAVASKLVDTHDPAFRYRQLLQVCVVFVCVVCVFACVCVQRVVTGWVGLE